MNHITIPSNIERICRICYILSYFTIPTIYLPIIAVLLVTYNELLWLILSALFADAIYVIGVQYIDNQYVFMR